MPLLDHVGVKVTNLDRSIKFYNELFGFQLVDRRMLGSSNVEAAAIQVGRSIIFLLNTAEFKSCDSDEHGGVDHFCLTFRNKGPTKYVHVGNRPTHSGTLPPLFECFSCIDSLTCLFGRLTVLVHPSGTARRVRPAK